MKLSDINPKEVAFLGYGEGGSMGRFGDITIINTKGEMYEDNFVFSGLKVWNEVKAAIPITHYFYVDKECFGKKSRQLLDEAGYAYRYLGDGTHLVFKKEYIQKFNKKTSHFLPIKPDDETTDELINFEFSWEDTALEIIRELS